LTASTVYTEREVLRDLPLKSRVYIVSVIVTAAVLFAVLIPRAGFQPILPLTFLILLSSLTSAFKVQFAITSGSNMSVSYVVDIAALILRGPHAAMICSAASGWSQSVLNARRRNPPHRTLFNMAVLVLTAQASGQVFQRLGGRVDASLPALALPIVGMSLTYFVMNTGAVAIAIALSTHQNAWQIWRRDFISSAPSYLLGAATAAVVIKVGESAGYALTLLLAVPVLYLTMKMYRAGAESEARQGAILEAAQDAIITMDGELTIREFNPAAEQMFGYARLDILGRNVDMLMPEADRSQYLPGMREYLTSGRGPLAGRQLEISGLKADGTEFPIELSLARLGSGASMTAFARDVSSRRSLEAQLRQSQKLEAIGRLSSGVAHDFNNILMSIMGAADLLLMQLEEDAPARAEAQEIKVAVERGAGVTRQLLAFSRRTSTRAQMFALDKNVADMEKMLRRLIGPEIDFTIHKPAESVTVFADPGQIEQVLLNLVVNARDAMPEGGRLTVTVEPVELDDASAAAFAEGKPGHYGRLSVADSGHGMDEQVRAKLFEPFFTTKGEGKGTGLGLSIVYGIVKQSAGYITVNSEPGKGATFLIYLPMAPTAVAELVAAATV
jgi:PAS domain S-box-containing protein